MTTTLCKCEPGRHKWGDHQTDMRFLVCSECGAIAAFEDNREKIAVFVPDDRLRIEGEE